MQTTQKRVAVYVAGDSNIFFPALVALDSIQQHNPDQPFDYFMCFEGKNLTSHMTRLLDERGIQFVDIADIETYGSISDLPAMSENRWPQHVFYNWVVPLYLADLGYSYALKADYDILCVERYYLPDLIPEDQTVAALTFSIDLLNEGVTAERLDELGVTESTIPYYNAGVVGINLPRYKSADTFEAFKRVYALIQSGGAKVTNAEQAALSIVAWLDGDGIKPLDKSYNLRITQLPNFGNHTPPIRNIHYITQNKPWLPVDYRYLENYVKGNRTSVYIYRNIWLKYASDRFEDFATFVDVPAPTEVDTIRMFTKVLGAHYAANR